MRRQPLVVGIAGGTGSGKSTLVHLLLQTEIGSEITVLPHDHYYLSKDQVPSALIQCQNWDHPDAIDNTLYVQHLDQLSEGKSVERPEYCFESHHRKLGTQTVKPRRILLVEGILVFAVPEIRKRLQWRIYIEANPDERILRRLVRDTQERGRSISSVVHQYRTSVRPMHDQWIQPSRNHAHLVLPNAQEGSLEKGAEMLCGFLKSQIS